MVFSWLTVIILAYFFFSLSYFGDKLILSGPPKPLSYTFYVGAINIFAVLFVPFVPIGMPVPDSLPWIIAEAFVFILGLYMMFWALERFDVSRVMTTIGATQPIFIFCLAWIFWGPQILPLSNMVAFGLLLLGSILISIEKTSKKTGNYLIITLVASLLFSLDYVFSKVVFQYQPFWQGFIWMRIFVFLFALLLLLSKNNRREIFKKKSVISGKTSALFVATHSAGSVANILQGKAIDLAPVVVLPIVNSLRGIQYVFLLLITLFFSFFFPKILKEEISRKAVFQKVISILLIVAGLAMLIVY